MYITEYTQERAFLLSRLSFPTPNDAQVGVFWFDAVSGEALNQRIRYGEHTHSFYELQLVFSGSCAYECQGETVELTAGDALLIPPQTTHRLLQFSQDLLKISVAYFLEDAYAQMLPKVSSQRVRMMPEICSAVDQIFRTASQGNIFGPGIVYGKILEILQLIYSGIGLVFFEPEKRHIDSRFFVAKAYIANNSTRLLTCEKVACECGYSTKHLSRIFQNCTGKSLYAYIVDARLKRATELLMDQGKTVKEISMLMGFEKESSFVSFFKRHYGVTPGNFRKEKSQAQQLVFRSRIRK